MNFHVIINLKELCVRFDLASSFMENKNELRVCDEKRAGNDLIFHFRTNRIIEYNFLRKQCFNIYLTRRRNKIQC